MQYLNTVHAQLFCKAISYVGHLICPLIPRAGFEYLVFSTILYLLAMSSRSNFYFFTGCSHSYRTEPSVRLKVEKHVLDASQSSLANRLSCKE